MNQRKVYLEMSTIACANRSTRVAQIKRSSQKSFINPASTTTIIDQTLSTTHNAGVALTTALHMHRQHRSDIVNDSSHPELELPSDTSDTDPQADLAALENHIAQLLETMDRLRKENDSLKLTQESLVAEKANLVAKNEQARSRVEAMIGRLKSLEQGT